MGNGILKVVGTGKNCNIAYCKFFCNIAFILQYVVIEIEQRGMSTKKWEGSRSKPFGKQEILTSLSPHHLPNKNKYLYPSQGRFLGFNQKEKNKHRLALGEYNS